MRRLEVELESVFEEFRLLDGQEAFGEAPAVALTQERIVAIFDELAPLLAAINPDCIKLLAEIRRIPGAEELAQQIEDFDFSAAATTLAVFRAEMKEGPI